MKWLVGWLIDSKRSGKQFFSHVGTELPLPGYYQYFIGSKCALLKDTTRFDPSRARTPRPLDPESEALATSPPRSPLLKWKIYTLTEIALPELHVKK